MGYAIEALAASDQLNSTQVALSVGTALFYPWNQSIQHARLTKAQIVSDLKTSVTPADPSIHREVAKCVMTLSNRLSVIKADSSEGVPLSKLQNRY